MRVSRHYFRKVSAAASAFAREILRAKAYVAVLVLNAANNCGSRIIPFNVNHRFSFLLCAITVCMALVFAIAVTVLEGLAVCLFNTMHVHIKA